MNIIANWVCNNVITGWVCKIPKGMVQILNLAGKWNLGKYAWYVWWELCCRIWLFLNGW
jgi:hypothetical protein